MSKNEFLTSTANCSLLSILKLKNALCSGINLFWKTIWKQTQSGKLFWHGLLMIICGGTAFGQNNNSIQINFSCPFGLTPQALQNPCGLYAQAESGSTAAQIATTSCNQAPISTPTPQATPFPGVQNAIPAFSNPTAPSSYPPPANSNVTF